jgi:hypothetical protein
MNSFRSVGFESLKCPECGAAIPVSEAIAARVAEEANIKFSEREAQQRQLFAEVERELAERQATLERSNERSACESMLHSCNEPARRKGRRVSQSLWNLPT